MSSIGSTRRIGLVVAILAMFLVALGVAVFIVPGEGSLDRVSRDVRDVFEDAVEVVTDNIEGVFDTAEEIREDLQEATEKSE